MSASQVFVGIYAIVAVAISVLAIWRVATATTAKYKPLWIVGSLFGFAGFATSLGSPGDLHLQLGVQIPVLIITWTSGGGDIVLKALFPVVAAVALVKFHSPNRHPRE
jgi:low temperature requirement protein LtrA